MQTVIRTTPTPSRYTRYPDSYNDLKELLHAGWKVVMCNKIGDDLEYILKKERWKMNEKRCDVCGTMLDLNKDKTYLIRTVNFFTKEEMYSDAVDCEKCGCQNILKERKMRVEDGRKES